MRHCAYLPRTHEGDPLVASLISSRYFQRFLAGFAAGAVLLALHGGVA